MLLVCESPYQPCVNSAHRQCQGCPHFSQALPQMKAPTTKFSGQLGLSIRCPKLTKGHSTICPSLDLYKRFIGFCLLLLL